MFLVGNYKVSECKTKNLLITLGKLAINNYPSIILEYNNQFSAELKQFMTTVINNLQICSQLDSRISEIQSKLEMIDIDKNKEIANSYRDSISLKRSRLESLQEDNYQLLAQIGEGLFKERLLNHWQEFCRIYSQLEVRVEEQRCIKKQQNNYINQYIDKVVNFFL
ncbi:MAG: hypothetical protein ACQEQI_07120 [Bacillota bacterium]